MDNVARTRHWLRIAALLLILFVAAGLRFYRLPELPLGLHYDEAANGILASEIARGTKPPVFISSYTGKEALFFYWTALWMRVFGATRLALRLSAALVGLATVAATVWAVRELLYARRHALWVGLLTGMFLATSFWHLVLSRYGFRAATQPLLQTLTVATLWRGLRLASASPPQGRGKVQKALGRGRPELLWLILAGLCFGLTAYTYLAARAFPLPLGAALLTLLVAHRGRRSARLREVVTFLVVATLTLAPLLHYWLTHPGSFLNRTRQVAAASWGEAWAGLRACLGMFFIRGDPYVRFNIPYRPIFDPVAAGLFLAGLGIIIWQLMPLAGHRRRTSPLHLAANVFLLTYLPTMLLPSALATGEVTPSNLRAVGLLPFVYVFPALALSALASGLSGLVSEVSPRLSPATFHLLLVTLPLVLLTVATARAYFCDWAPSAALYYAADGDLVDVAAYLNQMGGTPAGVESVPAPYVASVHYRHPTLAFLARDYQAIKWLTGGRTLVFPAGRDALLIFPRSASKDLAWVQTVLPDDALVAQPPGPDGKPAFHVYHVGPGFDPAPAHPLTADLGRTALLQGYDVIGRPTSGERAEVAVWWRVLATPEWADYGSVARLADPWGFIWGETSPFRYPGEQWSPGELIVDHLSIPVAPGAPPGDYQVRFGLYSAQADARLPVLDAAGRFAGTWVGLPISLARAVPSGGEGPTPDDLGIRTRLDARVGDLVLLGANLDTTSARPGERVYLTLFWQAGASSLPDYTVSLTLGGRSLYADAPVHGTYPFSRWMSGELVRDRYDPRLSFDLPPGDYPLELCLSRPTAADSECALALDLGAVAVQEVERIFDVPPISHPLSINLGDQVELLGYDLSSETVAPGGVLTLTLYWRALAQMDEDYTVFTHILAPDGTMTGQQDAYPLGGTYPTSLWLPGEVVVDTYEISVRAGAMPGVHRLEVGMYVAETGARLAVARTSDDAVRLQTIVITER